MPDEIALADQDVAYSADPAHLFMQLYDRLPERLFLGRETADWRDNKEVRDCAEAVADLVVKQGPTEYRELAELVRWNGDQRLFTILLGLDSALLLANPFACAYEQHGLTEIAGRYAQTGLLNDPEVVPGALLPRCAISGGPRGRGHKEDFFAVHRVPANILDGDLVRYRVLEARYQPAFPGTQPVKVACAPLLQSYDELELTQNHSRTPSYRIAPADADDISARIPEIIEKMDAAGAQIGVMPEGCLSIKLLDQWRRIASETATPDKSLRWLLVGSGPIGGGQPPANRTVLLDRWTGETLLTHDKLERFTMTDDQAADWHLPWPSQGRPVEEDITRGRTTDVLETGLGRFAALICEDLNQSTRWERELATVGVSHLLVPIFSKPILRYRWEHEAAKRHVRNLGAWVVVSNTLVVAPRSRQKAECERQQTSRHTPASSAARWRLGAGPATEHETSSAAHTPRTTSAGSHAQTNPTTFPSYCPARCTPNGSVAAGPKS